MSKKADDLSPAFFNTYFCKQPVYASRLLYRHIIYVCCFSVPVIAVAFCIICILFIDEVVNISIRINPVSISIRCDNKRMSVRVTIQGSCLICIGQLFLCESTGICCCSGAITVVCCCCICRSICCCCVRRTICCCITGICICCRLSCCITGICICLCCILYRSLLWSCFLQCGIPKDLERFYCGFNRSKSILCFYSGVDLYSTLYSFANTL